MDPPASKPGSPPGPEQHPVLALPPLDDSGSATQARFAFQHHCTARLVFAMLGASSVDLVVCERHEDAVVFYADGTVELVSIKHFDDQTLPLSALREALIALFRRWQHTGRIARCRLMTNGAPAPGRDKSKGLIEACHKRRPEEWIDRVKQWTSSTDTDEVGRFLEGFSADDPTGSRDHIEAINCQTVVTPALAAARLNLDPKAAHDRVVELVASCNRDQPIDHAAMLEYLTDPNRASPTARVQQQIGRRAIDAQRLTAVLLEPAITGARAQLSFDDAVARDGSTLRRKLVLGGFGQTTLNAARLLRANWEATETRWRADVPGGDPQFADLRARALATAARAERATRREGTYGPAMHAQLEQTLTMDSLGSHPSFALDDDLLLGLVYELTDECHIWWSEPQAA